MYKLLSFCNCVDQHYVLYALNDFFYRGLTATTVVLTVCRFMEISFLVTNDGCYVILLVTVSIIRRTDYNCSY
jgi:hypothetical protein